VISNAALVVATLGLATPWAAVRSWRYQTAAIHVVAASDLAEFVDGQIQAGSAFGDAAADFEGFDLGI